MKRKQEVNQMRYVFSCIYVKRFDELNSIKS